MTWSYSQGTGKLSRAGVVVAEGYSGTGAGRNNPAIQGAANVGPIPQGDYMIGAPHDTPTHGPYVLRLTPAPTDQMFGRSGFLIHGDNTRHDASQGCIILEREARHDIWESGDRALRVTL